MAEYINKEKMLKYLEENNTADEWIVGQYNADWIYSFIESQPKADVVEVKHGEWSRGTEPSGSVYAHCSSCNRKINYSCYGYAYCSLCGARMDGTPKERGGEK